MKQSSVGSQELSQACDSQWPKLRCAYLSPDRADPLNDRPTWRVGVSHSAQLLNCMASELTRHTLPRFFWHFGGTLPLNDDPGASGRLSFCLFPYLKQPP